MVIPVAHQAVLKVILREISSLNSGTCQVMTDTKIAGLYSILKLMVSAVFSSWLTVFAKLGHFLYAYLVITSICWLCIHQLKTFTSLCRHECSV
jgi:hypothetical protein